MRRSHCPSFAALFAVILSTAVLGTMFACSHGDISGAADFVPKQLASCGASKSFFTTPPIALERSQAWVPLGALNPPGHTFPTDHQYIYLTTFSSTGEAVPLYAPGNVTIVGARRVNYSAGVQDYALDFMPCREVVANFGHVRTIAPGLLAQLGAFDQRCETYSPEPSTTVSDCYTKPLDIRVNAGDVIGTSAGLDLSLFDSRARPLVFANASRWITNSSGIDHFHVVPFSDYFSEPARSSVRALLGQFDGKTRRSAEPLGGTIETDLAGTAQGAWFNPVQPNNPEAPHLAIVPDNVDPSRFIVSVGLSQPGITPGAYVVLAPFGGGAIVPPAQVSVGTPVVCWEIGYLFTVPDRRGVVLAQLVDATTLRVEARAGGTRSCVSEAPFAFTASASVYKR